MKRNIVLFAALALSTQAYAATVYDSGVANGDGAGGFSSSISGQTGVADFSLSSATSLQSFTISLVTGNGTPATSTNVQWAIYSRSGGVVSMLEGSGTANGLSSSNLVIIGGNSGYDDFDYDVYDVTVNVGGLNLAAGDYFLSTARDNNQNQAYWATTGGVDGDFGAMTNTLGAFGQTSDISGTAQTNNDYAFTLDGNSITVVPLPPAALGGLAMLAGLGAYRRIRK